MNRKQTIVLVIVALLALGGFIYVFVSQNISAPNAEDQSDTLTEEDVADTLAEEDVIDQKEENNRIAEDLGQRPVPGDNETVVGTKNITDESGLNIEDEATSTDPTTQEEPTTQTEKVTLSFGDNKISPAEFTVSAGDLVELKLVSSGDEPNYFFLFSDPALSNVSLGLSGKETREITFWAPKEPGSYEFESNSPGHKEMGYVGTMIVN